MLSQPKLGKLLKYDFYSIFKYFIPMSLFILLYSCFGTLLFKVNDSKAFENNGLLGILIAFTLAAYIIVIIAYYIITQALIVVNFYKSMVTDTGYLTHTLPVKKSTLIISKLISGLGTLYLSYIVLALCLFIMLDVPTNFTLYHKEFVTALKLGTNLIGTATIVKLVLNFFFTLLVGSIQTLSMYFASIALGQLMNRHKVVGAFASFFALSFVMQLASSIFSFLFREVISAINSNVVSHISRLFFGSTLIMLLISCVFLFITHYIFSRKLNLE